MSTLITKLPESVTDGTLSKLGEIAIKFNIPQDTAIANRKIVIGHNNVTATLRIVGSGNFVNSSDVSLGKEITTSLGQNTIYLSTGEFIVFVGDKYKLEVLNLADVPSGYEFVSDMKYTSLLVNVNIPYANKDAEEPLYLSDLDLSYVNQFKAVVSTASNKIVGSFKNFNLVRLGVLQVTRQSAFEGDFADLTGSTNLVDFRVGYTASHGNFVNLGGNVNLSIISVEKCSGVTGALEDFLDALKTNGKVSSNISLFLVDSGVTYGGAVITTNKTATFDASGNWTVS